MTRTKTKAPAIPRHPLWAETAADLMMPNPISIRENATLREAVALLTDKGFSAAPVIDDAGRPVGVLSRSDILVHDREKVDYVEPEPEFYHKGDLVTRSGESLRGGFQVEKVDRTLVSDLMTPAVFSVAPDTPAPQVIDQMLGLKVHRLFVVDPGGILVGVISVLDILRHLRP
jgi:CBS domain-containing protein